MPRRCRRCHRAPGLCTHGARADHLPRPVAPWRVCALQPDREWAIVTARPGHPQPILERLQTNHTALERHLFGRRANDETADLLKTCLRRHSADVDDDVELREGSLHDSHTCSLLAEWTLTLDMATGRWERLQLAALRLREIPIEAQAIYRRFPELDRRPKIGRAPRPQAARARPVAITWASKLH